MTPTKVGILLFTIITRPTMLLTQSELLDYQGNLINCNLLQSSIAILRLNS